ncbi:hypothetical protein AXF24_12225 [Streptococcus pneumoniae]|nr:hypothetical protein AXF24_12225 [Streptococcus pneumoniae]
MELLDAGIDVWTTVNIQHLESLNDVVMRITGVRVSETVPDGVLDRLHDIVLVDLPPRELIARLQQGKVYVPEQAAQALQAFFSPANLTALRELAMQEAADRVDSSLREARAADQTREPEPGKALPEGQRAIFVVQLHHASRRHYDFRLQVGDALKSWAVPKGPSYDPKVKRMAVEGEDHPVDYAAFEGEIPKGQYGGGHVAQFDHGVWATQGDPEAQLAKGHLRFELFGAKLKGGWHLVR